jgi:hypothetical protein
LERTAGRPKIDSDEPPPSAELASLVLPPEDRETIEYRKHFKRVMASCLSNIAAA